MRGVRKFKLEEKKSNYGASRRDNNARRKKAINARYYFHYKLCRKPYDVVMELLEQEFYISSDTIARTMDVVEIRQMTAGNATAETLATQFPHFNWQTC